jgi:endonuclease/exonuclease/phosphatase family metal-dependent hydrolase
MRQLLLLISSLLLACSGPRPGSTPDAGAPEVAGSPDAGGRPDAGSLPDGGLLLRLMAANLTSGNLQSYDPGEGIRIFQGLHPDVVMLQEFNFGTNSDADLRNFVDTAFGPSFSYYRGAGGQIPNGIVSRYPMLESGDWTDPNVSNRAFTWAHLGLPGQQDLWVISLHLLTSSAANRSAEAQALVADIQGAIPAGDLLVLGGDLNTSTTGETAISTLSAVVVTSGGQPADQSGNTDTNSSRSKAYDHVFLSPPLQDFTVPVTIGRENFVDGLVFDSRVYSPLTDVAPVQSTDSGATNMQHMAVVRDVRITR